MTFDYKQMLKDREAGTKGAACRRIKAIPDMESEIIRLREALEALMPILDQPGVAGCKEVNKARAALKGDDQ